MGGALNPSKGAAAGKFQGANETLRKREMEGKTCIKWKMKSRASARPIVSREGISKKGEKKRKERRGIRWNFERETGTRFYDSACSTDSIG